MLHVRVLQHSSAAVLWASLYDTGTSGFNGYGWLPSVSAREFCAASHRSTPYYLILLEYETAGALLVLVLVLYE